MNGRVVHLHLAPAEGAPMVAHDALAAEAGVGITGDRYALRAGHYSSSGGDGRQVTLIEAEVLDDLAARGMSLAPGATRRNVTTEGVGLNDLVGRRFRIGDVELVGRRPCEPCTYMQELVGQPVLAPLVHRGGLRADILVGGELRIGDPVAPIEELVPAASTAQEGDP